MPADSDEKFPAFGPKNEQQRIIWMLDALTKRVGHLGESFARVEEALKAVGQLRGDHEKLEEQVNDLKIAVATLQTKAAAWGAVAGFVATTIVALAAKYLH